MFGKENISLYRDDGLAIIKKYQHVWQTKQEKNFIKLSNNLAGLKITADSNLHAVNFLDVTFDLSTGKYKPYAESPKTIRHT